MSGPVDIAVDLGLGGESRVRGEHRVDAAPSQEASFQALVKAHAAPVHGLARRLTGNAADAEELVQETFLKAWRALARFRRDADLRTWLHRILINTWRDLERRRVLAERGPLRARRTSRDPATGLAQKDLLASVLLAVEALPRRQRECLLLRVRLGLGHREIADLLGIGVGSVKSHLLAARRKLLQRFDGEVRR